MLRISDLRHKDIINNIDGKRLGFIRDVELNLREGRIDALVLPAENRFIGLLSRAEDINVLWPQIQKIGVDVILIEMEKITPVQRDSEKRRYREEDYEALISEWEDDY